MRPLECEGSSQRFLSRDDFGASRDDQSMEARDPQSLLPLWKACRSIFAAPSVDQEAALHFQEDRLADNQGDAGDGSFAPARIGQRGDRFGGYS